MKDFLAYLTHTSSHHQETLSNHIFYGIVLFQVKYCVQQKVLGVGWSNE